MGGARRATFAVALVAALAAALALACVASAAKTPKTVWLCKPSNKSNPCLTSRAKTVVTYEGETRQETVVAQAKSRKPPIDCFYVYPTVSEQETPNANLEIEPQETQIAIDQASRFSQNCRVYAPMYKQLTLKAIKEPVTTQEELTAFEGVFAAFHEYLAKFNKGRGFVLIGHSQGSAMLEALISSAIDPNPALRKQLVSAILLGGQVLVPEGEGVGGTFQHVPACTAATDIGCVIAYSSFLKEPPENSFFGRPNSALFGGSVPPGSEVLCVNPATYTQTGAVGTLIPEAPTTPFPGTIGGGTPTPTATTPWVQTTNLITAQCKHENGATWLNVAFKEGVGQTDPGKPRGTQRSRRGTGRARMGPAPLRRQHRARQPGQHGRDPVSGLRPRTLEPSRAGLSRATPQSRPDPPRAALACPRTARPSPCAARGRDPGPGRSQHRQIRSRR